MKFMKDRLKEYIQQHKSELDLKSPPSELFDKIMVKSFPVDKKESGKFFKLNFSNPIRYYYAAASLILGIGLFYFLQNDTSSSPSFANQTMQQNIPLSSVSETSNKDVKRLENNIQLASQIPTSQEKISKQQNLKQSPSFKKQELDIQSNGNSSLLANEQKENKKTPSQKDVFTTPGLPLETLSKDIVTNIQENKNENTSGVISKTTETINTSNEINKIEDVAIEANQNQSLGKTLRKSFFNLLSKKTSEWTDNTLTIKESETSHKTIIAVDYKSEIFEMSKSLSFPSR